MSSTVHTTKGSRVHLLSGDNLGCPQCAHQTTISCAVKGSKVRNRERDRVSGWVWKDMNSKKWRALQLAGGTQSEQQKGEAGGLYLYSFDDTHINTYLYRVASDAVVRLQQVLLRVREQKRSAGAVS